MRSKQEGVSKSTEQFQDYYSTKSDQYRTEIDEKFGIRSSLKPNYTGNKEDYWVRDATDPLRLSDKNRPSHNSPEIEVLNMQLRCLSRLRAIDYAIAKKSADPKLAVKVKEGLEAIRQDLMGRFGTLHKLVEQNITKASDGTTDEAKLVIINELEEAFNSTLLKNLHNANLTQGCETKKDAEDLLNYYRNMSSLLDPARPMITKSYDTVAGVLQIETQFPITKKTPEQKEFMEKMRKIQPYPLEEERNSHNVRKVAFQEVDSLFLDLMQEDNRLLAAQTRKTHEAGVKNAYIVKNELYKVGKAQVKKFVPTEEQQKEAKPLWFARTGSPVYLGKGGLEKSILENTNENLKQIRQAMHDRVSEDIDDPHLHITSLLTNIPLDGQDKVLSYLDKATKKDIYLSLSNVPANLIGTAYSPSIRAGLITINEAGGIGQRATRMEMAANVILAAFNQFYITVIQCNSGQDRTGVAAELTTQIWMKKWYQSNELKVNNIETVRAEAGNAAEMASHLVMGSRGLKKESRARNWFGNAHVFSEMMEEQLHLKSAGTNKNSDIDGKVDFLFKPSQVALDEYISLSKKLLSSYDTLFNAQDNPKFSGYYESTKIVLNNIKAILQKKGALSTQSIDLIKGSKIDSKTLSDLTIIIKHCTIILDNQLGINTTNEKEVEESITRLASLSKVVSGRESKAWKNVGKALMVFACLTLVALGLIAAIPSGGTSLLAVVVGAVGLSTTATTTITATTALASGIAGYAAKNRGEEKGLAQALRFFKETPKPDNKTKTNDEDNTNQPRK